MGTVTKISSNQLQSIFSNRHAFLPFSFLVLLDKGLTFVMPLFVLFLTQSNGVYGKIEYVLSIGQVVVPLAALGFNNYIFYGYVNATNKKQFLSLVLIINLGVSAILFALIPVILFVNFPGIYLVIGLLLYTIYNNFYQFYTSYSRVSDTPSNAPILSIVNNVFIGIFLLLFVKQVVHFPDLYFFSYLIFSLGLIAYSFISKIELPRGDDFANLVRLIKKATIYSWPITLNFFTAVALTNITKVYVFNSFDGLDMAYYSSLLRISLLLFLFHQTYLGYYSKKLYESSLSSSFQIYAKYFMVMMVISVSVFAIQVVWSGIMFSNFVHSGLLMLLVVLGSLLRCFVAAIEIQYNKSNKTKMILYANMISIVFFVFLLLFFNNTIMKIAMDFVLAQGALFSIIIFSISRLYIKGVV